MLQRRPTAGGEHRTEWRSRVPTGLFNHLLLYTLHRPIDIVLYFGLLQTNATLALLTLTVQVHSN